MNEVTEILLNDSTSGRIFPARNKFGWAHAKGEGVSETFEEANRALEVLVMKLSHSAVTEASEFEPMSGTWSGSFDSDWLKTSDIESALANQLEQSLGFEVKVQIFRENGFAIGDYIPSSGTFVAVRA